MFFFIVEALVFWGVGVLSVGAIRPLAPDYICIVSKRTKAPISFFSLLGWGFLPQAPTYLFSYKEKT